MPSLTLRGMLPADRRTCLPETPSSMDASGGSWNRRPAPESVVPRLTPNRELGSSFTTPGVKDEEREKGGFRRYKSVTMAPTSTYLSDRRYVARRPLFAAEPQTSILKKTNVQTSQREEVSGRMELAICFNFRFIRNLYPKLLTSENKENLSIQLKLEL